MAEAAANHTDEPLTPKQVAALLHVTPSTVRRWILSGFLPAQRLPGLGPRYRVKRGDALALASRPVVPS